jgi:hypothetical protein
MSTNELTPGRWQSASNWAWIIGLFLIARVAYSSLAAAVVWDGDVVPQWVGDPIYETHRITAPEWGEAGRLLVNAWFRWDTGWYLKIAALGYSADDGSIIFPPLYPLLVRAVQPAAGGNYLLAGLLVSNVSALAAFWLFHKTARQELQSDSRAVAAVLCLAAFPTAFYLLAAYSEALFLTLALAAWLFARRQRWGWAGVCGGLAALARLQGWLLVLPLVWLMFAGPSTGARETPLEEMRRVVRSATTRSAWLQFLSQLKAGGWAALLLPVLGFAGYMLWLRLTGLGSIASAYAEYWHMRVVTPWEGVQLFATRLALGNLLLTDWVDLGVLGLFVALAAYGLPRVRPALSLFVWATLGLILMRGYSAQLLAGFTRHVITLFPVFLVLGDLNRYRWLYYPLLTVFLVLQFLLLWLFLQWVWVA